MAGLPRLVPGTWVRLTRRSQVAGQDETMTLTVPDLTVPLERGASSVRGRLPASEVGVVELGDVLAETGYRPTVKVPVAADADGWYAAALPPAVVLRPGWRGLLRYAVAPRWELVAESVLRHYRVGWHTTGMEAVVSPSTRVTVTLTTEKGACWSRSAARPST